MGKKKGFFYFIILQVYLAKVIIRSTHYIYIIIKFYTKYDLPQDGKIENNS